MMSIKKLFYAFAILLITFDTTNSIKFSTKKSLVNSDIIDEIDGKKLDKLIEENESVALFIYPRSCEEECQLIVNKLENINDEADEFGIFLVRNSERAVAKKFNIPKIPALVYFKHNRDPTIYSSDLKNEDQILEWLNSIKSLDIPDKIEEINSKNLQNVIDEYDYVAVLFYENNCKKCERVLQELENIDDEASENNIGFVKISDRELAFEYGLETLPSLVYYRKQIPIVYTGDLEDEEAVLDWLNEFRDTVEEAEETDDSIIEDVNSKVLQALIQNTDSLAVLFYDAHNKNNERILQELENIDDETDKENILFVKIDDKAVAKTYGIDPHEMPALVYFENQIPNFYEGNLKDEEKLLEWLIQQKNNDEIESVTAEVFEKMLDENDRLAVIFYESSSVKSNIVLEDLELIDTHLDKLDLLMIKIDDEKLAEEYGVLDELPTLIYFEHKLPSIYQGDLRNEDKVLRWLQTQLNTDEIEEVNHEILEDLIEENEHVAVLFYETSSLSQAASKGKSSLKNSDSDNKKSKNEQVLNALEEIDDDLDQHGILFVKTNDLDLLKSHNLLIGKRILPLLVFFENEIPHVYEGDLVKKKQVLDWIVEQKLSEEIEEVNSNTLETMINDDETIAVYFYDKDDKLSDKLLDELEKIDEKCDELNINFVKINDKKLAKSFGLVDELPILVYFEKKLPSVYEGDLNEEEEVLNWLIKQKNDDTIEEVTEEILEKLIKNNNYVLVFFAPNNCKECDKILHELENIDDDLDLHGMMFVTTDDFNLARNKYKIKKFPSLVLFRNEDDFSVYEGEDLSDEEKILEWVTSVDLLDDPDNIEELNQKSLERLLDRSEHVVVLFSRENKCRQCDLVKEELEKIDHVVEENGIDFVMVNNELIAKEFSVSTFPTIIFFNKRFPQFFDGKNILDEDEVLEWIIKQKKSNKREDEIEIVSKEILKILIDDLPSVAVFFYNEKSCESCQKILLELETIDDDSFAKGIHFVRCHDVEYAKELDIVKLPTLVYFENKKPSIYTDDLEDENLVLTWLIRQKTEDTIEEINREMLFKMVAEHDYLTVFFYKKNDDESDEIIEHLEIIDDDLSEFDIHLVKITDDLIAKKYGIRQLPGLIFFRKQKPIKFDGNLFDEEEILDWLTKIENMDSEDAIEKVNKKMFERLLGKVNYLAVLFYSEDECKQCEKIINELENIDDDANEAGIKFVKVEDESLAKNYGVHALPALLFFKKGDEEDPIIFAGDLKKSNKILDWLINQKDPDSDTIEEVDANQLKELIEKEQHLVVYFYGEKCESCDEILEELENIDTQANKHGVLLVKIQDKLLANYYGCTNLPSLVYFEQKIPSVYQKELTAESVLQWVLEQKSEDTIEEVNREILEQMVDNTHYLVVLFYKANCRACEIVIEELENIDHVLDIYGINMVKIQDIQLAKRYAIRTFPALMYFRNGNPLLFDGDLRNEDAVLEWLIDDDNRELQDEIEHVNGRMLEKLILESPFLVVFFYEDDCDDNYNSCEAILENLEKIDGQLDIFGIDFVKVNDPSAISFYRISHLPSLVYFRKKNYYSYDGDLLDEKKLLSWLTSEDVFELKDEIEEVNRKMLDKFLNENDYIAVYFYDNDCVECEEVLERIEGIDDDANDLGIMFVKIRDLRYAKKYGITNMPSLVFFRKKFPSLYRGDLTKEEEVLEWLKKNRYRHPEISIFMYGLILVTGGFISYTLFLIFFMKPKEKKE